MERTKRPLYREIASLLQAIENCRVTNNTSWLDKHEDRLSKLCKEYLPSGSGIDCGTTLERELCKPDKLVFSFSYHHMNDCGMYDGWTDYKLVVRPCFDGIDLKISGKDRNMIKEYLYDTYNCALNELVTIE
jgi:hypothetical protein